MKIVDRYILRTLLVPLLYCLLAFVMIYVIYDLQSNLDDFIDAKTPIRMVLRYYLFLIPSVLIYISPISILLAVLYSLYQLSRHNELTAMRASGISIFRLLTPVILIGILSSMAVTAVNESLGPMAAYWSSNFLNREKNQDDTPLSTHKGYEIAYRNLGKDRTWYIKEIDGRTRQLKEVVVTQEHPNGFNDFKVIAEEAQFLDGRWWFINLTTQHFTKQGHPKGFPVVERRREMVEFEETPDHFLNVIKRPEFMSALELKRYLDSEHNLSTKKYSRLATDFHFRLALPWSCLLATLLGVPFGLTTARKGVVTGIVICLSLYFTYYAVVQVFLALGKNGSLAPMPAVWVPNLLFLGLGAALITRVR